MHEEGMDQVFARHAACAAASRAGLRALGLELVADPAYASQTVTAAWLGDRDWKSYNGKIKGHGVVLAGGQGKLSGRILRLGHLGSVTVEDVLDVIAVLERVELEEGRALEPGKAVGAAQAAALAVEVPGAAGAGADAATVPA
jgi:aspartate aminotransferase-like enzyme